MCKHCPQHVRLKAGNLDLVCAPKLDELECVLALSINSLRRGLDLADERVVRGDLATHFHDLWRDLWVLGQAEEVKPRISMILGVFFTGIGNRRSQYGYWVRRDHMLTRPAMRTFSYVA